MLKQSESPLSPSQAVLLYQRCHLLLTCMQHNPCVNTSIITELKEEFRWESLLWTTGFYKTVYKPRQTNELLVSDLDHQITNEIQSFSKRVRLIQMIVHLLQYFNNLIIRNITVNTIHIHHKISALTERWRIKCKDVVVVDVVGCICPSHSIQSYSNCLSLFYNQTLLFL